jgi:hypothetical protein
MLFGAVPCGVGIVLLKLGEKVPPVKPMSAAVSQLPPDPVGISGAMLISKVTELFVGALVTVDDLCKSGPSTACLNDQLMLTRAYVSRSTT